MSKKRRSGQWPLHRQPRKILDAFIAFDHLGNAQNLKAAYHVRKQQSQENLAK